MQGDDIIAYTYKAELYCPTCIIERVVADLIASEAVAFAVTETLARMKPTSEEALDWLAPYAEADRTNERSFDSDTFPKTVRRDQVRGTEYPAYDPNGGETADACARCGILLGED